MLADSSALVALLDRSEPDHERCLSATERYAGSLTTTWPAFTEAMYLLHRGAGWAGADALWLLAERGHLQLAEQGVAAQQRMHELMSAYRDMPMALADASLVSLAEDRRETRILSLDAHFHAYVATWGRRQHGFEVVP